MKTIKSLALALSLSGFALTSFAHDVGNWSSTAGEVWKNTPGECWRTGFWTPPTLCLVATVPSSKKPKRLCPKLTLSSLRLQLLLHLLQPPPQQRLLHQHQHQHQLCHPKSLMPLMRSSILINLLSSLKAKPSWMIWRIKSKPSIWKSSSLWVTPTQWVPMDTTKNCLCAVHKL